MSEDTHDAESLDDTQYDESENGQDNWEKRYKDLQPAYTKASMKSKELEKALAKLEGQVSTLTALGTKASEEPTKDWLSEINPTDVIDNPEELLNVLGRLRSDIASQFVDLLEKRDRSYDERLTSISPSTISKNKLIEMYEEEIAELKEDKDLSELSDYALAKIAERTKPKDEPIYGTPHIGGRRNVSVDTSGKAAEAKILAQMKKMYPAEWFEKEGK